MAIGRLVVQNARLARTISALIEGLRSSCHMLYFMYSISITQLHAILAKIGSQGASLVNYNASRVFIGILL